MAMPPGCWNSRTLAHFSNDGKKCPGWREFLQTVIVGIGNQDVAGVVHRHATREVKLAIFFSLSTVKDANPFQRQDARPWSSSSGGRNEIRIIRNLVNGQLPILGSVKDLLEVRDVDFLLIRVLKDTANAGVKRHVIYAVSFQQGKYLLRVLAF